MDVFTETQPQQIDEIPNLSDEKWVQLNGKLVPISKLERLASDEFDACVEGYLFHLMKNNGVNREERLRRWGELLDRAEKRLDQILFLKDTALSHPPPRRVKVASTDSDKFSELIPSFLFDEEEDKSKIGLISEMEGVTKIRIKPISSVIVKENVDATESENFQPEDIVEAAVNDIEGKNQVEFGECFNLILNSSYDIFDPGKEKLQVNKNGYLPTSSFTTSIASILANNGVIGTARNLNPAVCFHLYFASTCSVFDPGKRIGESRLLAAKRGIVYEIVLKQGSQFDLFFMDSIAYVLVRNVDTAKICNLFIKMLLLDNVCFKWIPFVSSYPCSNFTCGVFDRGKEIELLGRYSCSCTIILTGSTSMDYISEMYLGLGYQKVQFMYSLVCMLAQKSDSGVDWFIMGFTSVACLVVGGYSETKFLCQIKVFKSARLMTQDYHTREANSHLYVVSFDPAVGRNLDSQVVISGGKGTITKSNVDIEIVGMFTVAGQALKFLSLSYRFDLGYESELQFIYMIVFVPVKECDYGDGRLKMSQTNIIFENTFSTLWWHVVVMEMSDELYYRRLLQEHTVEAKLIQNDATGDKRGVLWKVLLFPLFHFYLRGTENGCGYVLIFITLLGSRRSIIPCISGNENHFLLQLKSGLSGKRGATREFFWGYGCYAVFIFSNNYAQPHTFNNSLILSRSFCQMHHHISIVHQPASCVLLLNIKLFTNSGAEFFLLLLKCRLLDLLHDDDIMSYPLWFMGYKPLTSNIQLEFSGSLMETQVLLNLVQILDVLSRFEFLRWKFKLIPTGWWSVRNVSWTVMIFISVVSFDEKWTSKCFLFGKPDIHNQITAHLMRFLGWYLAAAGRFFCMVKLTSWKSLYTLHCGWYSCGAQQISLYKCNSTRYLLPCYNFVCGLSYLMGKGHICLIGALVWIVGIHVRLVILQYPIVVRVRVLLSVRYTKWSCRRMSCSACYFRSSCSQVTTLMYLTLTKPSTKKRPLTGYNMAKFLWRGVSTNYFPAGLHILNVNQWTVVKRMSFQLKQLADRVISTVHVKGAVQRGQYLEDYNFTLYLAREQHSYSRPYTRIVS